MQGTGSPEGSVPPSCQEEFPWRSAGICAEGLRRRGRRAGQWGGAGPGRDRDPRSGTRAPGRGAGRRQKAEEEREGRRPGSATRFSGHRSLRDAAHRAGLPASAQARSLIHQPGRLRGWQGEGAVPPPVPAGGEGVIAKRGGEHI